MVNRHIDFQLFALQLTRSEMSKSFNKFKSAIIIFTSAPIGSETFRPLRKLRQTDQPTKQTDVQSGSYREVSIPIIIIQDFNVIERKLKYNANNIITDLYIMYV